MRPCTWLPLIVLTVMAQVSLADEEPAPFASERVRFAAAGEGGPELEGELLWLQRDDLPPVRPGVVVCHPDPRYGGTMDNRVVRDLAQRLAGVGYVTLRFNYRGVGQSAGMSTAGGDEQEPRDCAGAIAYLRARPEVAAHRVAIVGYSFGAAMAVRVAAADASLKACAAVAFPLAPDTQDYAPYAYVRDLKTPALFATGSEDSISDLGKIRRLMGLVGLKAEFAEIAGADHFYADPQLRAGMTESVVAFVRERL